MDIKEYDRRSHTPFLCQEGLFFLITHQRVIEDLPCFRIEVDSGNQADHRVIFEAVVIGLLIFLHGILDTTHFFIVEHGTFLRDARSKQHPVLFYALKVRVPVKGPPAKYLEGIPSASDIVLPDDPVGTFREAVRDTDRTLPEILHLSLISSWGFESVNLQL